MDTLERVQILRDLRLGVFDVLVGINLLREGIDLPEVTLVAILDADKEGFLRSAWSLIQMIGRAARNIGGEVVMYADRVTESMRAAIDETDRRRAIQERYNVEHGIEPTTIVKEIHDINERLRVVAEIDDASYGAGRTRRATSRAPTRAQVEALVARMEAEMKAAAKSLEFERAAALRDEIQQIRLAGPRAGRLGHRGPRRRGGAATAARAGASGRRRGRAAPGHGAEPRGAAGAGSRGHRDRPVAAGRRGARRSPTGTARRLAAGHPRRAR